MQFWTVTELMHLTRDELFAIDTEERIRLRVLEGGTLARLYALTSLDNIRRIVVMRGLHY